MSSHRLLRSAAFQILCLSLLLAGLIAVSCGMGYTRIGFFDVVRIVLAKLTDVSSQTDGINRLVPVVIAEVRLPRILTSAAVGAGLALSGSAILSAGVSFIKYMADELVGVIIFWLMGSFASRTWGDIRKSPGTEHAGACFR